MSADSVMLVGGPGSGKTNYIARLWLAFKAKKGALRAERLPTNIQYVDDAVRHLMALKFAPRSERNMEDGRRDFVIEVRGDAGAGPVRSLTVPDITGELWKRAVNTYELPQDWINALEGSSSAILFIRAHCKLNVQPMDWVTARDLLKMEAAPGADALDVDDGDYEDDDDEDDDVDPAFPPMSAPVMPQSQAQAASQSEAGAGVTEAAMTDAQENAALARAAVEPDTLPAQVRFCELLRYLSLLLSDRPDGSKPRVAIVVTAWDRLDGKAKAAGPMQYLKDQFPLLAGRVRAPGRLEIETFGMSIVGGDLRRDKAFRLSLQGRDLSEVGYTAIMRDGAMVEDPDVTLPIAWALGD